MVRLGQYGTGNRCETMPIFFPGSDNPETTANDVDGIFGGQNTTDLRPHPEFLKLTYTLDRVSPSWKYASPQCTGRSELRPCDEYPFASAFEAKKKLSALKLVPREQNSREGGLLAGFYTRCGLSGVEGAPFLVVPMPSGNAP